MVLSYMNNTHVAYRMFADTPTDGSSINMTFLTIQTALSAGVEAMVNQLQALYITQLVDTIFKSHQAE